MSEMDCSLIIAKGHHLSTTRTKEDSIVLDQSKNGLWLDILVVVCRNTRKMLQLPNVLELDQLPSLEIW